MKLLGLIAVLITGSLLLLTVGDLPAWGDPNSPASKSPISTHFIKETLNETSVPNLVTAVLADYRGFDTLFETVVVLTGGIAIIAILGRPSRARKPILSTAKKDESEGLIIYTTCRILIPIIQLFALYVIMHGHHSPGGGFQGGVMLGASFILLAVAGDLPSALQRLSEQRALILACAGVLIYAGIGVICLLLGNNFLDYGVLSRILPATTIVAARSHSMLGVEIGVAFTVASVMFLIYAHLSSQGKLQDGL